MGGVCAGAPKKYVEYEDRDADLGVKASMKSAWFRVADQEDWNCDPKELIDALVPPGDQDEGHEERAALALIELDAFKNGAHLLGLSGEVIARVDEAMGIVKQSVTNRALKRLENQARAKVQRFDKNLQNAVTELGKN